MKDLKKLNKNSIIPVEQNFALNDEETTDKLDLISSSLDKKQSSKPDQLMSEILMIHKKLNNVLETTNEYKDIENKEIKWKYAALLFDRLFFFISVIYFIITFSTIILTMPIFNSFN